jgi:hypothetical protein
MSIAEAEERVKAFRGKAPSVVAPFVTFLLAHSDASDVYMSIDFELRCKVNLSILFLLLSLAPERELPTSIR